MKFCTVQKGFTLVETLVAITVLLLVVIGPMTVAQKGIQSAYYANEQVTAVFLAQEAIEAVRELRDGDAINAYDEIINGTGGEDTWDWYTNLPADCTNVNEGCAFNVDQGAFQSCNVNNDCVLNLDGEGNYNYEGGNDSIFERRVYIGDTLVDGGVPVTVDVRWTSKLFQSGERFVTLQTWVYDHYQRYEN